jgi:hypothetical protein
MFTVVKMDTFSGGLYDLICLFLRSTDEALWPVPNHIIDMCVHVNSPYSYVHMFWVVFEWTIGVLGFDSRRGLGIFLFTTASRTALGPTQPPVQWVQGGSFPGDKAAGGEADQSPPSSTEVKE